MKIAFFGARDYDRIWFEPLARQQQEAGFPCDIHFLEANLTQDTAVLARGHEAVCAFVNSDLGERVLDILHSCGVGLVLLRCAGFNNVDMGAARRLNMTVLRVPNYSPEAVAEHAMTLALAANRRIHRAYSKVRENDFSLTGLLGQTLHRRTAGIVGTGKIGSAMINLCRGFGMRVLAYDAYPSSQLRQMTTYVSLEELLRESDLVSLHCPLTQETYHLINRETISIMKDTAILVNTSRGALIDTEALLEALRRKKFAAVGLDVYEDEDELVYEDFSDDVITNETVPRLLAYPNVVVTSHQGFLTTEALQAIAIVTLENAYAYAHGLPLENEVR